MNAFKTAVIVGVVTAIGTWCVVYLSIHQPSFWRADGDLTYATSCFGHDDDDVTAFLWAAGSYFVTFMPTLLLLRGRIRKDVFAP